MKEYKYKLRLCDGYLCDGVLTVLAENEEESYSKAIEHVGMKLYQAFPELSIDYSLEFVN